MKNEPGISDQRDLDAEQVAVTRARADAAAGRVHDHKIVGEWLKTWGTDERRPFREWLAARNG